MTTLGFERGSSATTGHRRFQRELDQIIAEAEGNGKASDPLIRQRLATAWTKVKIMEINGYRSLTDALNGTHLMAALGACNKMFWSEYHQDVMELAIDILGLEGQILTGTYDDTVDPRLRLDGTTIRSTTCRHPSSSRGRRPSGEGRRRSSAISSASGCSGCPRSPSRSVPAGDRAAGRHSPSDRRTVSRTVAQANWQLRGRGLRARPGRWWEVCRAAATPRPSWRSGCRRPSAP